MTQALAACLRNRWSIGNISRAMGWQVLAMLAAALFLTACVTPPALDSNLKRCKTVKYTDGVAQEVCFRGQHYAVRDVGLYAPELSLEHEPESVAEAFAALGPKTGSPSEYCWGCRSYLRMEGAAAEHFWSDGPLPSVVTPFDTHPGLAKYVTPKPNVAKVIKPATPRAFPGRNFVRPKAQPAAPKDTGLIEASNGRTQYPAKAHHVRLHKSKSAECKSKACRKTQEGKVLREQAAKMAQAGTSRRP